MDAFTVTSKGQVTIPQDIRRALGIRQGSRVAFVAKNGKAELRVLHRAPEAVVSGFGMLGARGRQVPADFDAASLLVPKLAPKLAPGRAACRSRRRCAWRVEAPAAHRAAKRKGRPRHHEHGRRQGDSRFPSAPAQKAKSWALADQGKWLLAQYLRV